MYCKFALATLAMLIGNEFTSAQQIPFTTTAAELWNPWTWFWPYAIATAEAYRDYYEKAQKATNELYQQVYKTNAFPLITGNWSAPQISGGSEQENSSQQNQTIQEGSTLSSTTQQPSQQSTSPAPVSSTTESNGTEVQGNVQNDDTDGTPDAGVQQ